MGNTADRAFRTWKAPQSREAQHYPEQPLPNDDSLQQQHQENLDLGVRIDNIQQALRFGINELEMLRPPVPYTEPMARQPEEGLTNSLPTSYISDFSSTSINHAPQEQGHKRKRDEASSSRVPADSTTVDAVSQASNTDHTAQETPRNARSEAATQRWKKSAYRAKQEKARNTDEFHAKLSEAAKQKWKDPAYRDKLSEATKNQWADPASRKKILAGRKRSKAQKESEKAKE